MSSCADSSAGGLVSFRNKLTTYEYVMREKERLKAAAERRAQQAAAGPGSRGLGRLRSFQHTRIAPVVSPALPLVPRGQILWA